MILLVVFLIILLVSFIKNRYSVASVILLLYSLSLIGTYFLSPSGFMAKNLSFWGALFLIVSHLMLIIPWRNFKLTGAFSTNVSYNDLKRYKLLKKVGIVCFVLNVIVIGMLLTMVTDFSSFKNGDDSTYFYAQLPIPSIILLLMSYISPLMIMLIPYHFYFIKNNNTKEAFLSLLVSFNFVLTGLTVFSRSTAVTYALVFAVFFLFNRNGIPSRIMRYYKLLTFIMVAVLAVSLLIITLNRFAGENLYSAELMMYNDTILKDPVSASVLSYFSQWYIYATKWVDLYNWNPTNGLLSLPLWNLIMSRIFGLDYYSDNNTTSVLMNYYKSDYGVFMGCPVYMLNDIGLLFTFIILFIYVSAVGKIKAHLSNLSYQMLMCMLLIFPLLGIFSSALHLFYFHLGVFYCMYIIIFKR